LKFEIHVLIHVIHVNKTCQVTKQNKILSMIANYVCQVIKVNIEYQQRLQMYQ
jgi:hypothetical protein